MVRHGPSHKMGWDSLAHAAGGMDMNNADTLEQIREYIAQYDMGSISQFEAITRIATLIARWAAQS